MKSDIEIAQSAKIKPIEEIARNAGLNKKDVEPYGKNKAKIKLSAFDRLKNKKDGKLILVTTITPTSKGEGKTTTVIGLGQALSKIRRKTFICIREPSLGPTMGIKGGAAGGGYSQVIPMEDINLHFTGDMHMISSAHNLLAAMIDNHIFHGDELKIDKNRLIWHRVMDMCDRALRNIKVGIGYDNLEHMDGFDIAAASEVMAIICLSNSLTDMKKRLNKIIIGFSLDGMPIHACDLKASGAMALLLKEVIKPNLVQSIEGVPAFVHGGPFANIAHGCNTLIATKLALKLADYVVTEAGFASDLGAEKFFDIKCRLGGLTPSCAVLVVTSKAYDVNGPENLAKHIENIKMFGVPLVVAINKSCSDTQPKIDIIKNECEKQGVAAIESEIWEKGGLGGIKIAKKVVSLCNAKSSFKPLYKLSSSIKDKINTIAGKIYGADGVDYTTEAENNIIELEKLNLEGLPVCIAKTQYSLSDNHKLQGRPKGFKITIRRLKPCEGAGFIVAYAGDILTMPGFPKHPAAENIDIDENGKIEGLF